MEDGGICTCNIRRATNCLKQLSSIEAGEGEMWAETGLETYSVE